MSERIYTLARAAGLIAPYGSDREGLRDFDYRMFAQLIVKECAKIADKAEPYKASDLIKQHFGVEE
jgi:hypothetical protein